MLVLKPPFNIRRLALPQKLARSYAQQHDPPTPPRTLEQILPNLCGPVRVVGTKREDQWWYLCADTNYAVLRDWFHPTLFLTFRDTKGTLIGPIAYPGKVRTWGFKVGLGLRLGITHVDKNKFNSEFESIPEQFLVASATDISALVFGQKLLIDRKHVPLLSFGISLPLGPYGVSHAKMCGEFQRQIPNETIPRSADAFPWLKFLLFWVASVYLVWWIYTHMVYNVVEFIIPFDQLWLAHGLPVSPEEERVLSDLFEWFQGSADAPVNIPEEVFAFYDKDQDGLLTERELYMALHRMVWYYHEVALQDLVLPVSGRILAPYLGWTDPRALDLARASLRTSLLLTHDRTLNDDLVASLNQRPTRPYSKQEFVKFLSELKECRYFENLKHDICYSLFFPTNSDRPHVRSTMSVLGPSKLTTVHLRGPDPNDILTIDATYTSLVLGGSRRMVYPVVLRSDLKPDPLQLPFSGLVQQPAPSLVPLSQ